MNKNPAIVTAENNNSAIVMEKDNNHVMVMAGLNNVFFLCVLLRLCSGQARGSYCIAQRVTCDENGESFGVFINVISLIISIKRRFYPF